MKVAPLARLFFVYCENLSSIRQSARGERTVSFGKSKTVGKVKGVALH